MKLTINTDPYQQGQPLFARSTVVINPGLTFLVGCNGAGKTAFLQEVEEACRQDGNYRVEKFDPLLDAPAAEGEIYASSFAHFVEQIYKQVQEIDKDEKIVVLADLSQSGVTADAISNLKDKLNSRVLPTVTSRGLTFYMIVAASDFEFFLDEESMDVQTFNRLRFNNYTGFKKYLVNSQVAREKRYKKILASKK